MKTITRGIIGAAGMASVATFFGTVGGTVLKKAAETYCKTPGGQLAVYSIGSVGYIITIYPIIEKASARVTNWIFKEEDEKWLNERMKAYEELLKKKEEES